MNMKTALLTAACALALTACGDKAEPPAAETAAPPAATTDSAPAATTPAPAAPAATPPASEAAAAPTSASKAAVVTDCQTEIESNDAMQYNVNSITVPASCTDFTIVLKHVGSMPVEAMGHNVVISTSGDMQGVVTDGMAAGLDAGYLKANDERVIAHTDMIGGGETTEVSFPVSKIQGGGPYKFFCSFPGHSVLMNGTITVE